MRSAARLSLVCALGAASGLVGAAPAQAQDALQLRRDRTGAPVSARGSAATPQARSVEERAAGYLAAAREGLGVAPGVELALVGARRTHGFDVVRFVPRVQGRRVLGGSVLVRLRGGRVDHVSLSGVGVDRLHAPALLDAPPAGLVPAGSRILEVEAIALPTEAGLTPGWSIDLAGATTSARRRLLIDARSGLVLGVEPRVHDALGRVYARDPISDDDTTTDVDLPFLTSNSFLTGRYFRVASCNASGRGCDAEQTAVADSNGDFLIDPNEPSFDDPFVEVHAYYHANIVAEYFRDTHDFTWLCGADEIMRVFVNYSEAPDVPFDNAAYSPGGGNDCGFMLFGQGQLVDFAYDADVIYHEFGHAVIDQASEIGVFAVETMGVSYEPGALNEGIADYFSSTISGDPQLAEYFARSGATGEGALRELDNTLSCPGGLVGESHFDGRLIGGLGWELREAHGAAVVDPLFFVAAGSLNGSAGLAEFAEALIATVDTLAAEGALSMEIRDDVVARTEARGLVDCERIAPLDGGVSRRGYSGIGDLTAGLGAGVAPIHYRVDIPADATSLAVRFEPDPRSPNARFRVHFSEGTPVRVSGTRIFSDFDLPTDSAGVVTVRIDREPALPRCTTLYMAVVTEDLRSIGQALYVVSADVSRSSGGESACEEPDAGAGADGGADASAEFTVAGGGGCDCGVAPGRRSADAYAGAIWLLCALWGLALWRRRPKGQ